MDVNDLADALIEQAAHHRMVAHDCDCPPESTLNWQHYIECGNAATELRRLSAEVERLPAALSSPDGYAYEFASPFGGTVLRFDSDTWNGSKPIRSIPFVFVDTARAALAKEHSGSSLRDGDAV